MDFTKDIMFRIKYEQDKDIVKINKQSREKKNIFLEKIKRHKIITCTCIIGVLLICTDIILVNNFVNILRKF